MSAAELQQPPESVATVDNSTRYVGERTRGRNDVMVVDEDGERDLPPRTDLANHSPSGFEWGYGGSGPAQLALALLADAVDDETALEHYQQFKWDVVAGLEGDTWELTEDVITRWLASRQPAAGEVFTGP